MNDTAIKVEGVAKDFVLRHKRANSVKSAVINAFASKGTAEKQHVLKGISFEVKKGEFFGIVGRNGSGKSTMLKILAGIYQPNKGTVQVSGKLVSFIELGVGFNPELTGRENIYLNGAMLGFTRKEIDDMYDDIVEFAELERFMDQKLKNYSSGMQVRLAFSVAIKAKGDILVLDEVLAVGDEAFQRKCNEFFNKIKKDKSKTVVLVTHSMDAVRQYCDTAILIKDGKIVSKGDPQEVANEYSLQFVGKTTNEPVQKNRYGSGKVIYENIKHTLTKEKLTIEFDIVNKTSENHSGIISGYDFYVGGIPVFGNSTEHINGYKKGIDLKSKEKRHFKVAFDNNFGNNRFDVTMTIATGLGSEYTDRLHPAFSFDSINVGYYDGFKILGFPEITEN